MALPPERQLRALLVEDNDLVRTLTLKMLEES
jgi:CheY-like chemotaxis protein